MPAFFARASLTAACAATLKWLSCPTATAGPGGRRVQISGNESTREVHRLRSHSDGILRGVAPAGATTLLTARGFPDDIDPPVRIVLDPQLQMDLTQIDSQPRQTRQCWSVVRSD